MAVIEGMDLQLVKVINCNDINIETAEVLNWALTITKINQLTTVLFYTSAIWISLFNSGFKASDETLTIHSSDCKKNSNFAFLGWQNNFIKLH